MHRTASPLAVWTGLFVLYVVWGSTYLGIKVAIETVPPFVMGFLRFVPAGLLLTAAVLIRHRGAIRRPAPPELRDAAIVGAMLLTGGTGLVAWGEQTVASGVAALLIGLVPMWLAVLGRMLFGERLPAMAAVGIGLGLVGVTLLVWPAEGVGQLDAAGFAALLVAPLFWSLGTLYAAHRALLPSPVLLASGLEMIAGGLASLVAAAVTGELLTFDPAAVSSLSWAGIAYLVVVGSVVGYSTYAWLLGVAPLSRVSTYAYVNPVVAVALGWLLVGEPLTPSTILAAVVIVAAVVLIVTARGRATRPSTVAVDGPAVVPEPARGA